MKQVQIIRAKGMKTTAKTIAEGLSAKLTRKRTLLCWGQKIKILNYNIVTNKLKALKMCRDAGIGVPKIYRNFSNIKKFPVVGRDLHHYQARDLVLIKNKQDYVKKDYYLEYIPKIAEYRIHYCLGKYYPCKKIPKDNTASKIICNHGHGWRFVTYDGKYKQQLIDFAKKVIDVMQYDFGAIDCIMDKHHRLYFLEINSAPGLDKRRQSFYLEAFKQGGVK